MKNIIKHEKANNEVSMKISKINNNTCCNNNITTMEKHVTIENKELIKADIGEKSKYNTNECNKTNKEN